MCGYMAPALLSSPKDLIHNNMNDSSAADPSAKKGYSENSIHGELFRRFESVSCANHSHAEQVLPYVIGTGVKTSGCVIT